VLLSGFVAMMAGLPLPLSTSSPSAAGNAGSGKKAGCSVICSATTACSSCRVGEVADIRRRGLAGQTWG
jgi:hypothetical protein